MPTPTRRAPTDPATPPAPPRRSWLELANCVGRSELFFERFNERPSRRARREAAAKRLCAECAVRDVCREIGRVNRESGIWGGETDEERAVAGYPPHGAVRRSVVTATQVRRRTEALRLLEENPGA